VRNEKIREQTSRCTSKRSPTDQNPWPYIAASLVSSPRTSVAKPAMSSERFVSVISARWTRRPIFKCFRPPSRPLLSRPVPQDATDDAATSRVSVEVQSFVAKFRHEHTTDGSRDLSVRFGENIGRQSGVWSLAVLTIARDKRLNSNARRYWVLRLRRHFAVEWKRGRRANVRVVRCVPRRDGRLGLGFVKTRYELS